MKTDEMLLETTMENAQKFTEKLQGMNTGVNEVWSIYQELGGRYFWCENVLDILIADGQSSVIELRIGFPVDSTMNEYTIEISDALNVLPAWEVKYMIDHLKTTVGLIVLQMSLEPRD